MHAFDVLGDPVRRRILELLLGEEWSAGDIARVIRTEFGISQPAVSQHLRVLREAGFARVRGDGTRRLYAVEAGPLQDVDQWLAPFRAFWTGRRDAIGTELAGAPPKLTGTPEAPAPPLRFRSTSGRG